MFTNSSTSQRFFTENNVLTPKRETLNFHALLPNTPLKSQARL